MFNLDHLNSQREWTYFTSASQLLFLERALLAFSGALCHLLVTLYWISASSHHQLNLYMRLFTVCSVRTSIIAHHLYWSEKRDSDFGFARAQSLFNLSWSTHLDEGVAAANNSIKSEIRPPKILMQSRSLYCMTEGNQQITQQKYMLTPIKDLWHGQVSAWTKECYTSTQSHIRKFTTGRRVTNDGMSNSQRIAKSCKSKGRWSRTRNAHQMVKWHQCSPPGILKHPPSKKQQYGSPPGNLIVRNVVKQPHHHHHSAANLKWHPSEVHQKSYQQHQVPSKQ